MIDANANPPAAAASPNFVTGVGTILFNMAVKPSNGLLYVSNLEARNFERFEALFESPPGSGTFRGVRGHIGREPDHGHQQHRGDAAPPELARQLQRRDRAAVGDRSEPRVPARHGLLARQQLALRGRLRLGQESRCSTPADLEDGDASITNDPVRTWAAARAASRSTIANDRLYVMNRFDQQIAIVQNATNAATAFALERRSTSATTPSAGVAKNGRRFLYDASTTSGHGDAACASCHIFGDFDSLAWDLGDPFGDVARQPEPLPRSA